MEQLKFQLSKLARTTKPNMKTEWRLLSDNEPIELTFEELIVAVGEWGHSFCHAVFTDDIRYAHFESSQLIVLDFDNKEQVFHPAKALERLQQIDLDCNGIYMTLSDPTDSSNLTEDELLNTVERYRMIFILDRPVEKLFIFLHMLQQLYAIFPEADKCHATQIWAGGKGVIYKNEDFRLTPMLLVNVIQNMDTEGMCSKRRTKKFEDKIRALPDEVLQMEDAIQENPRVPKTTDCNSNILHYAGKRTTPIRGFDWEAARMECKLLDDFLGVKRKIYHYELFGLYTALKRIEGGRKRWRNSVRENSLIDDQKIETIGTWIDKFEEYGGYKWEWRLESYVPVNDPALLKFHRLTDIHFGRQGAARKISDHYHVPLKDAELSFKHLFREAKSEIGNGVYIFKCATGLGKSEELMHTNLDGCIVAVPTHKLKDELSQRMTTAKIKHIVIPELPSELPEGIQKKYDAYLAAGFFNYANGYLRSLKTEKLVKLGVPLKEATSLSLELNNGS